MTATLLDVTPDEYHADPYDGYSLNATVAAALVLETPAHAKQKHPKLADNYEPKHTDAMDEGTALHQMLLGDDRVDIFDYDAFNTKEARAARDASRAAGRVPMKRKDWDEIALLGDSLKAQVAAWSDPRFPWPLFVDGRAEQTIVWEEEHDGETLGFRARLDWLRTDLETIDDLKKARSAKPRRFHGAMWSLGYPIKAAFYLRACKAAFGVEPVFRWVAIEPDPPYAMTVHVLTPEALHKAKADVDLAIEIWAECLRTGEWPAYPQRVQLVDLPAWLQPQEWDDTALMEVPF